MGYLWIVDDPNDILNANWARLRSQLANISAGKPFFEFAFRMIYMNANDEGNSKNNVGDRCEAAIDKVLREKLDLSAESPLISIINCGHYIDTPYEP